MLCCFSICIQSCIMLRFAEMSLCHRRFHPCHSSLILTTLPSPVLLQVFPVIVRTALSQCVPLMGGLIPVPVLLAVWDSRTTSLSLACAVSATPVPVNPARETRGMSGSEVSVGKAQYDTLPSLSYSLFLPWF